MQSSFIDEILKTIENDSKWGKKEKESFLRGIRGLKFSLITLINMINNYSKNKNQKFKNQNIPNEQIKQFQEQYKNLIPSKSNSLILERITLYFDKVICNQCCEFILFVFNQTSNHNNSNKLPGNGENIINLVRYINNLTDTRKDELLLTEQVYASLLNANALNIKGFQDLTKFINQLEKTLQRIKNTVEPSQKNCLDKLLMCCIKPTINDSEIEFIQLSHHARDLILVTTQMVATDFFGENCLLEDSDNFTGLKSGDALYVDISGKGDYKTLQQAFNALESSPKNIQRIVIKPGVYRESIIINKPIEIVGEGKREKIIVESENKPAFFLKGSNITLKNITLKLVKKETGTSNAYTIDIVSSNNKVESCDISSEGLACIAVHGRTNNVIIKGNSIHHSKSSGLFIYDESKCIVEDNIIFENNKAGVEVKGERTNPTIRNNSVYSNISSGIYVHEKAAATVEMNEVYENTLSNIEIRNEANPIVIKNQIYSGKASGIYVYENGKGKIEENDIFNNIKAGIEVRTGGDPFVHKNRFHDGRDVGILCHEGGLGTYQENDINLNKLSGIEVRTKAQPNVNKNLIFENGEAGIFICETGKGLYQENEIYKNRTHGIEVRIGSDPQIKSNTIRDCFSAGIFIYENSQGLVESNTIYNCARAGIEVRTGGNPLIKWNLIYNCKAAGIYIYDNASGKYIENEIHSNKRAGIELKSKSNALIGGNTIHDNEGSGIFIYEDKTIATITKNDICKNHLEGIDIRNGGHGEIKECKINENFKYGVQILNSSANIIGNDLTKNKGGAIFQKDSKITKNNNWE